MHLFRLTVLFFALLSSVANGGKIILVKFSKEEKSLEVDEKWGLNKLKKKIREMFGLKGQRIYLVRNGKRLTGVKCGVGDVIEVHRMTVEVGLDVGLDEGKPKIVTKTFPVFPGMLCSKLLKVVRKGFGLKECEVGLVYKGQKLGSDDIVPQEGYEEGLKVVRYVTVKYGAVSQEFEVTRGTKVSNLVEEARGRFGLNQKGEVDVKHKRREGNKQLKLKLEDQVPFRGALEIVDVGYGNIKVKYGEREEKISYDKEWKLATLKKNIHKKFGLEKGSQISLWQNEVELSKIRNLDYTAEIKVLLDGVLFVKFGERMDKFGFYPGMKVGGLEPAVRKTYGLDGIVYLKDLKQNRILGDKDQVPYKKRDKECKKNKNMEDMEVVGSFKVIAFILDEPKNVKIEITVNHGMKVSKLEEEVGKKLQWFKPLVLWYYGKQLNSEEEVVSQIYQANKPLPIFPIQLEVQSVCVRFGPHMFQKHFPYYPGMDVETLVPAVREKFKLDGKVLYLKDLEQNRILGDKEQVPSDGKLEVVN